MNVKDKLVLALSNIKFNGEDVPISQIKDDGNQTYITFQLLSEPTEMCADDEEEITSIYFSVDIYTNNIAFDSLVKNVRERLKKAGFIITNRGPEIYDKDTELYHIVTDCMIENLEED